MLDVNPLAGLARLTGELWREGSTVDGLRRKLSPRELADCGEEVGEIDEIPADASCFDGSRPAYKQWNMGASVCHRAFAASDGFPVSPCMNETGIGAVVRKENDYGVLRNAEIIEGLKHDADLFVEVGKHLWEILRIAFVTDAWSSIRFFLAIRRRLPREMRQVGRVVGEERLLLFRVGLDEVEIDFEVDVRPVAVSDFIGDDTIVTHQIGLPKAGGFLTFLIKDAPSLVVIESELADRVVSVLQGYVPFSHNLC